MHRIIAGDEFSHFELGEDLTAHHHHLVCTRCGRVDDVTLTDSIEETLDERSMPPPPSTGSAPSTTASTSSASASPAPEHDAG